MAGTGASRMHLNLYYLIPLGAMLWAMWYYSRGEK